MKPVIAVAACLLVLAGNALSQEAPATKQPANDEATAFGALPFIYNAALSADGKRLVAVAPGNGANTLALVLDLDANAKNKITPVYQANGQPMSVEECNWAALDRVVCSLTGIQRVFGTLAPVRRNVSLDAEAKGPVVQLGQKDSGHGASVMQSDGHIVDWLDGTSGKVLMARAKVPDLDMGSLTARKAVGLSVDRVDTRTGKGEVVETPDNMAIDYVSDGEGLVRLKVITAKDDEDGHLKGRNVYYFRSEDSRTWKKLGIFDDKVGGIQPLAVDPSVNGAYVLQPLDGRQALYRVHLDSSMNQELVFSSPEVDVGDVVRMGRSGHVIGVTWTTDRNMVQYFDPKYRGIAATLAKALPNLPLVRFVSASADEKILLVWAGSDVDPGHFYTYDLRNQKLAEVFQSRPALHGKTLSPVRAITYPAADGTQIPAYLTLPPGVTDAKGLPAIVMPHGGPESRDDWGFDWLSQYFAQRGYVVLQPNYRGSSGYGDQWLMNNGFKSWKTAVGDICDGGKWLVSQGMAAPAKLAIFGWSYGGYAALQAQVLAPDLFKAVVAVAPVTDLPLMKEEAQEYTNGMLVNRFVGDGPHLTEGSPARNAAAFKAPVLMFHGDTDVNVDIAQSHRMDDKLREAGKSTELVVYPKLEHSLVDGTARADMLRRSDAFLRKSLGM